MTIVSLGLGPQLVPHDRGPSAPPGLLDKRLRPPTAADRTAGPRTLAARLGEELCSLVDASNCLGQAASDSA
jgi:hypothetical protein